MSKELISYFSVAGNNYWNGQIVNLEKGTTEKVAEKLQKLTGANIYEIRTQKNMSQIMKKEPKKQKQSSEAMLDRCFRKNFLTWLILTSYTSDALSGGTWCRCRCFLFLKTSTRQTKSSGLFALTKETDSETVCVGWNIPVRYKNRDTLSWVLFCGFGQSRLSSFSNLQLHSKFPRIFHRNTFPPQLWKSHDFFSK